MVIPGKDGFLPEILGYQPWVKRSLECLTSQLHLDKLIRVLNPACRHLLNLYFFFSLSIDFESLYERGLPPPFRNRCDIPLVLTPSSFSHSWV